MKPHILLLSLFTLHYSLFAAPAAPAPLFSDNFDQTRAANTQLPPDWSAAFHGNVSATITRDTTLKHDGNASIRFTNNSAFAAHVWSSFTSKQRFPVTGGSTLNLSLYAAGTSSGRAFAAIVFSPTGGESRLYLPEGNFTWRRISQNILVPEGAKAAQIRIGSESPTTSLNIDTISVTLSNKQLSNLPAKFHPRQPAPDGTSTIFPKANKPADAIDSLDVQKLSQDELLLATTLQGILNKKHPRIYLYHSERDRFWADHLLQQKYVGTITELPNLKTLVEKYRAEIPGTITYDPAVKATKHAAMLIGSFQNTPATSEKISAKYKLPVLQNLSGKFAKNIDVYRHLWTTYRPQLASHVLAVHHPDMTNQGPRDYLAQQHIFTFWISAYSDPDPAADPAAELEFAHEVLAATPPNIPIMGWFSYGDTQGISEYDAVRLASSYAKFMAGSEFNTNLSLLSGIPVPPETFRQRHITPENLPPLDPSKLYVSLSVIDSGDSTWYWQHYQHKHWQDPARGSVPINWSMNPTILDIMPSVTAWFYQNATPNDLLYVAISGLGYMNSTLYATRYTSTDREKVWAEYLQLLSTYMQRLDQNILGLYAGSWAEPASTMKPIYERFSKLPNLLGILSDFGRHEKTSSSNATEFTSNNTPVLHTLMRWIQWSHTDEVARQKDSASVAFTLNDLLAHAPKQRPAIMSGLILSWTMSPTLTKQVTDQLPSDIQPARADQLLLYSKQLPKK